MPVSIERLRLWMLLLAGLLAAAVLAFFGYARWQARSIRRDLPAKLGVSIERSANGFSVSKSVGGRTLFTLHAAKMDQYKGEGQAALRDVSITLYGSDGAPADRIYGDNFAYDPVHNVVRANGAVQIDLQGFASSSASPSPGNDGGKNMVHVKTADLVFDQKTGLASTPAAIEFHVGDAAGSAKGASFDAHTGVCILDSSVAFNTSLDGNPLAVRASHAHFDRASHRLYLLAGTADYNGSHTSSDEATILFRPDGSAYRLEMQGHVSTGDSNQTIRSPEAHVDLDGKSQPERAFLNGGLFYTGDYPARQLHGTANSGVLSFGPKNMVRHAQLKDAVSVVDQERSTPVAPVPQAGKTGTKPSQSTSREVEAAQIDIDFAQSPAGRAVARQILAQGGATLKVHTLSAGSPPQETEVQGDQLFVTLRDGVAVSTLRGTGHTKLAMVAPSGLSQTSTGDNLRMDFAPTPSTKSAGAAPAKPQQAATLESAEQDGNVVFVQQPPEPGAEGFNAQHGGGAPESGQMRAMAQRAVYNAAGQLITLYGGVRPGAAATGGVRVNPSIQQAGGDLSATTIEFERVTGNATAVGNVKATYRQDTGPPSGVAFGGPEPVHVIAAKAHLDHAKDLTIFYGEAGADARLWQGADSISAPVLELSSAQRTLDAHGAGDSRARAVSAVLTGRGEPGEAAQPGKPGQLSVVRVSSRNLHYSDRESEAQFGGGVVMQDVSGSVRSDAMDVYFGPGNATAGSGGARAGAVSAKQVERIVARGQVQLEQPSRRGTGEMLVYTANDGKFVLTGTKGKPPRLIDQTHGTVTGSSLIFNNRDDSVIVSGGPSQAVTETRTAK